MYIGLSNLGLGPIVVHFDVLEIRARVKDRVRPIELLHPSVIIVVWILIPGLHGVDLPVDSRVPVSDVPQVTLEVAEVYRIETDLLGVSVA